MHVVEHLRSTGNLWREIARLLKPGGKAYIETPGPQSVTTPSPPQQFRGKVTMNFYDDPTHVAPVSIDSLAVSAKATGLVMRAEGQSRNWLFVAAYPLLAVLPATRQRFVARLHWLGWSVYLIAQRPAQ
jgi:hypothetical protein